MPINFPGNPNQNQTHTHSGITWTFDGTVWRKSTAGESTGFTGSIGYTGSAGSSGTNGFAGSAGTAGAAGYTGSAGTAGNVATIYDVATSSTGYFAIPTGNTAQRPAITANGYIRYNTTTGYGEMYTSAGWANIGQSPPSISTVTPLTFNGEQGTSFTINGSNFTVDAVVKFVTVAGTEYTAGSISFVNSATLIATTSKDFTVAEGPLDIKIIQLSGTTTKVDVIDCGTTPTWTTASGSIATTYYPGNVAVNTSVTAVDNDANATIVLYTISSGSLPAGISLNGTTGAITGNTTDPGASSVTTNFSIIATDNAGNQSTARSFNIIQKWSDGSSSDQAASSASAIYSLSSTYRGAAANGKYWIKLPGQANATQVYCLMDNRIDSGGWMLSYQKTTGSTLAYTYKQLWYKNNSWNNTTFSHDTTNYPVLPNNISFGSLGFTHQLIHNQHPSWISYKGDYHWYLLQTSVSWSGTSITANNYTLSSSTQSTTTLWPRGVGWGTSTNIDTTWAWWADGANGGLCGGDFQCATAACPTASGAEGCHVNSTYPLLVFVK